MEKPIKAANEALAEILIQLCESLDYYGQESFKRQLRDYAKGNRSTNIGDMLCVPLGRMQGTIENYYLTFN